MTGRKRQRMGGTGKREEMTSMSKQELTYRDDLRNNVLKKIHHETLGMSGPCQNITLIIGSA